LETRGKPDAVVDLRSAAAEADAVLVVTSYRGRVLSLAYNALDWLTRRRPHGALHHKPLAVVGRSSGYYSGVLSSQIPYSRGGLGCRAVEPLTVRTLHEAVKKVADKVRGGSAAAAM
jgi:hypothetical protein